jgi:hypothetical protein
MTDPEGHLLVSARRVNDAFRNKPVWAVYKILRDSTAAESRDSDFLLMAAAKVVSDAMNATRHPGEAWYFAVFRLSPSRLPLPAAWRASRRIGDHPRYAKERGMRVSIPGVFTETPCLQVHIKDHVFRYKTLPIFSLELNHKRRNP